MYMSVVIIFELRFLLSLSVRANRWTGNQLGHPEVVFKMVRVEDPFAEEFFSK